MPSIHWKISYHKTAIVTYVEVEMTFRSEADIQTMLDMGFEEGFSMAYENLDALLLSLLN